MKLSQLTTDEFLDKVCDLTPLFEKLIKDEELNKIIKDKLILSENISKEEANTLIADKGIDKIFKLIPIILKKNRETIYNIMSIVNDKTIEEIQSQKIFDTIQEIKDIILDEEIRSLFFSLTA